MFDAATKATYLRRASGRVLAAYAIRYQRIPGVSFALDAWGDFTIALVVGIARYMMIAELRGYNAKNPADMAIRAVYDDATKILDELVDIKNATPRRDPDVTFGPQGDESLGSLASSEGGAFDEADAWATIPGLARFVQ